MKIRDLLSEAPIGDFDLIGNWGDKEKSNSFSDKRDRKLLQSPKAVTKIKKKFSNVSYDIDMYFVNSQGARKNAEMGEISLAEIDSLFRPEVATDLKEKIEASDEDNIKFIFVGNAGTNKKIMSGWIIGHRMGHAFNRSGRTRWSEYEREFFIIMREILKEYGYTLNRDKFMSDPILAKFYEKIGTMKSARDGNLGGRPYEFVYECFTQWLLTGRIKFNKLPRYFGNRNKTYRFKGNNEQYEEVDEYLHYMSSALDYECNGVLGTSYGKIFIM